MTPRPPSARGRAYPWARAAYLGLLVLALLSPFEFHWEPSLVSRELSGALDLSLSSGDAVDAVRNLVLFAGWGLLWVATARQEVSARTRILRATLTGVALSVAAETLQLVLPIRSPSLLDVTMNGAGAWVGAVAGVSTVRALKAWRERPSLLGVPMYAVAGPYLAAALTEAAFPLLRHTERPGSYGGPLTRTGWSLDQVGWDSLAVLPLTDLLLFLPAGVLCGLALRELQLGRSRAVGWTVGLGVGVAILGEVVHAPLGQTMQLGPALVHALAIGGGGWIGVAVLAEPARTAPARLRAGIFLAAYVALLLLWTARPYAPRTDPGAVLRQLAPGRWLPLDALGGRRDLYTVSDIFRSFLLFLPVGAVAAVRPLRRGGPLRALGPAVLVALGLELSQAFVAGRFFDVTDAVICFAGAGVAWRVVREAGLAERPPLLE